MRYRKFPLPDDPRLRSTLSLFRGRWNLEDGENNDSDKLNYEDNDRWYGFILYCNFYAGSFCSGDLFQCSWSCYDS